MFMQIVWVLKSQDSSINTISQTCWKNITASQLKLEHLKKPVFVLHWQTPFSTIHIIFNNLTPFTSIWKCEDKDKRNQILETSSERIKEEVKVAMTLSLT